MTAPTLPEYRETVAELRRRAELYLWRGVAIRSEVDRRRADALEAAADSLERQAAGL